VVDQTGILSAQTLVELNHLGDDVKNQAGAEMAVVVVNSTDGVDSHDFAGRRGEWELVDRGSDPPVRKRAEGAAVKMIEEPRG
jgi:uncharacterized membrane protein YgcG